jgi:hypothetical protein
MTAAVKRVPVALWGGLVVALLGWRIGFDRPGIGLDASWNAGLAMALDQGLHWGRDIVFTYGPLGFLQSGSVWFSGQSVLAFLYSGLVYVGFCVGLVWALRRRLPLVAAGVAAFVCVAVLPLLEMSLLAAVFACFWLLEEGAERTPRQLDAFVVAGATFAAPAALIKLSTGPLVALVRAGGASSPTWRCSPPSSWCSGWRPARASVPSPTSSPTRSRSRAATARRCCARPTSPPGR